MADSPVLLITGASTGIGAATARDAVDAGYRVALAARSADKLHELAESLGGDAHALAVATDVTEWDDNGALVSRTLETFGRIDAVFANAGFGAKRGYLEETPEFWKSMVLTNVLGVAYTVRATLPHIKERGTGHYVITSSIAGRRALPGSLYSATKHAATAIGETLRQELRNDDATKRVRMTLIEPGMVDTPFFDNPVSGALKPEDVSRAVMYALSQPEHVDVNEILVRPTSQAS